MTNKEKPVLLARSIIIITLLLLFVPSLFSVSIYSGSDFVLQKQQHQPLAQKYSAFSQVQNNITDKASVENTETLINKGLALYGLRKYQEAISLFDKALAIEPNNTMILINKQLAQQEQQLQPN
jgi:tetratricopeptide (TPR) repeat protein